MYRLNPRIKKTSLWRHLSAMINEKLTNIGEILVQLFTNNLSSVRIIPREVVSFVIKAMKNLTKENLAYLAGFLDGDGSVYVKLTKNKTYRFGYQVSSYIAFYQKDQYFDFLNDLRIKTGVGYMRKRKDGIAEWIIGDQESQLEMIEALKSFSVLKTKQLVLMKKIINKKKKIKTVKEFLSLCGLIDQYRDLNYSKKRIVNSLSIKKELLQKNLLTP